MAGSRTGVFAPSQKPKRYDVAPHPKTAPQSRKVRLREGFILATQLLRIFAV